MTRGVQAFHRDFTAAKVDGLPVRHLLSAPFHIVLLARSNSYVRVSSFDSVVSAIVIVVMMSGEDVLHRLAVETESFLKFVNWISFSSVDVNSLRNIVSEYIVTKVVLKHRDANDVECVWVGSFHSLKDIAFLICLLSKNNQL